jgi:hypothetical protein
MAYLGKRRLQAVTKSPKAQEFENGLLDEIRFDYEINSIWIKYRFDITLPEDDHGKVIFNGHENNAEFKKLKEFILNFEEDWSFQS